MPLLAWCCRRPLPKPSEMASSPASPSRPWQPGQPVALGKVGLDSTAGNPPWHGLQPESPARCASCSASPVPLPKMGWHCWQLSLVPFAPKSKYAPAFGAQRVNAITAATQHQLRATLLMISPLLADVLEPALSAARNDVVFITPSPRATRTYCSRISASSPQTALGSSLKTPVAPQPFSTAAHRAAAVNARRTARMYLRARVAHELAGIQLGWVCALADHV
jgi:hypothetical protein